MNTNTIFTLFLLLFGLTLSLAVFKVSARPAADEWIYVEVVVNILDGADAGNVDDAINENDEINKVKIHLVKKNNCP